MHMFDVAIFGAGPAGSVAAHVLAREGRRVVLVDPLGEAFKIGEMLPGAALRILRVLGLPTPEQSGLHTPIGGKLSCWGSEELIATDFFRDPDGPAWRLNRLHFDASLREAAICSGATFKEARLAEIQRSGNSWRLALTNGEIIESVWVIDATGKNAFVARRLGGHCLRDSRLIALYSVGQPSQKLMLNRTVIEATPNGWWYAGMLPSGTAMAGFHFLPKAANGLRPNAELWEHALNQTRYIKDIFRDVAFGFPIMVRDASGGCLSFPKADGWLACGDAAICFDPVSGQGVLSAIYGGMSGARAVHKALDGDTAGLNDYQGQLQVIRRTYQSRWKNVYTSQSRWPNEKFWIRMRSTN